jgi:acetylornithine deacetylase/succinyl-diaminopimelate desuccinylase-like protein
MPKIANDLDAFLTQHQSRIEEELFDFLRIPSVSAQPAHDSDTRAAANWVKRAMEQAGFAATVHDTPGHPVVLGEWRGAGDDAPTVLVYGHYDVQPPEPLDLWTSPPFEPEVRDGRIYARGSVDDKGQLFLHIKALEAHMRTRGALPVNIVVIAEGEEEVGSTNLEPFIESNRKLLAADAVVISDSSMFAEGMPSILSSLRGLSYFQIDVQGPSADLHSGIYGGAVVNPAAALASIIASMHDSDGRVAIAGFHDDISPFSDRVLAGMRELPHTDDAFKNEIGVTALGGETGYTTLEKLWTRPTCEVNGMLSGYTGDGAKTVLPAKAMAKVSCRLVPNQDPAKIAELFDAHVRKFTPAGVTATVSYIHGGRPWRADLSGPIFDAASRALQAAFDKEPVIVGEGGSIPVVGDFQRILGAPVLLVGFGLPGENAHAPDEWMSVDNFRKGTRAMAALWDEYAASLKSR